MDKGQLKDLIDFVLKDAKLHSESAVELLMGTAAVESKLGYYIKQVGGPACGIFQMEPATEKDIWQNYIRFNHDLVEYMAELGYYGSNDETLWYDLRYQILMARIHYRRFKGPLPAAGDILGQAKYWKDHYNTEKGKGTVAKYYKAYTTYCK